ncbi:MAG TPA: tyrosine-type recombinase/integrase [Propionibacteriaceae bacterium]|nr:tyrosine-type recombinase/integrase [Propionibacteriaceae bacterium]
MLTEGPGDHDEIALRTPYGDAQRRRDRGPNGQWKLRQDGRPLQPTYVTRLFNKLRSDLPEITFHGLRHSWVSLMIAGGADLAIVSKLAGHSSVSITADTYGHLVGTVAADAMNRAANLVRPHNALT